jgi:hypothetical protein
VRRAEGEGFYAWESHKESIAAGKWSVTTADQPVALDIPLANGGFFVLTATAKDAKTIRVLRRKGFGSLVKPVIHPSTAHAFIREQTEKNGGKLPQWIADNFSICEKASVSMRKE